MDNLTPITREEKLWNGEDLEPLTREEMYIKRIFDKTQTIPDKPLTRKEILMEKAGEGGGGDVAIKQLSVTANGTYSEEGTAYSPVNVAVPLAEKSITENGVYNASADSVAGYSKVNVNVPLPENAYLLKEASGSLVSFSDGADLPMPSFVCNISANQDLHGYDGPWVGGAGKNKLMQLNSSKTTNGITFTKNSDGTVTVNGTATNNAFFLFNARNNDISDLLPIVPTGTNCIISGCPSGGSTDTYRIMVAEMPNGSSYANDIGNGASFTYRENTSISIRISSDTTVNNLVFKPMLRLATETDPTFAPYSNICPISGHTGVDAWVRGINLCDEDFEAGGVKNNDGQNTSSTTRIRTKNYIRICPNTSYYGYYGDSTIKMYAFYYDENKTYIGTQGVLIDNRVFTTPENAYYMRISTYTNASPEPSTYDGVYHNNISINYPSTDTEYHAYNPQSQTIQVSWQTEAGEVFGGYVDLVSGVLTVDRVGVTYSDTDRKRDDGSFRLYPAPSNALVTNTDFEQPSPLFICDKFKFMSIAEIITTSAVNVGIGISKTSSGFYIKDTAMLQMTVEEAQTYLSNHPIDVVYPLATPTVYQLTPTQIKSLLGNNNAWCDTGDVDIDYFAKEVTE